MATNPFISAMLVKQLQDIGRAESASRQPIQQVQAPPVQLPVTGFDPALRGQISTPSGPPESQNMDAISQYKRAIADQPMHQDADPISKKRRLAGILLGATQGLANQGAGSRGEQMRQGVFDAPYNRKLADYNQELAQKQQLANIQLGEEARNQKQQVDAARIAMEGSQSQMYDARARLANQQISGVETPEQKLARSVATVTAQEGAKGLNNTVNPPHFDPITGLVTTTDKRTGKIVSQERFGPPGMSPEQHLEAVQKFAQQQHQESLAQAQALHNDSMSHSFELQNRGFEHADQVRSEKPAPPDKPLKPNELNEQLMLLSKDPQWASVIKNDGKGHFSIQGPSKMNRFMSSSESMNAEDEKVKKLQKFLRIMTPESKSGSGTGSDLPFELVK